MNATPIRQQARPIQGQAPTTAPPTAPLNGTAFDTLLHLNPTVRVAVYCRDGRLHYANASARDAGATDLRMAAARDDAYVNERINLIRRATDHDESHFIFRDLVAGRAVDYLCVREPLASTGEVVCVMIGGELSPFAPELDEEDIRWAERPTDPGVLGELTYAEIEVLRFIALHLSIEDMAAALFRTRKAIERRLASLRKKVSDKPRPDLMSLALAAGLNRLPAQRVPGFVHACRDRQRVLNRD